jgi:hypothetical protein
MTDDDNSLGPEPSWLDHTLRAALTHIPQESTATGSLPVALLEDIDRAIDDGWPQGRPMTVEELAADSGDSGGGHWSADVTHGHSWADPAAEFAEPDHLHGGHHHDDHSSHIDPDPEPHL